MSAVTVPVVRVAGMRKTYGRTVAVDEVSFDVADGEMIQCLAEHQIRVSDFRTVLPSLEDVFR